MQLKINKIAIWNTIGPVEWRLEMNMYYSRDSDAWNDWWSSFNNAQKLLIIFKVIFLLVIALTVTNY